MSQSRARFAVLLKWTVAIGAFSMGAGSAPAAAQSDGAQTDSAQSDSARTHQRAESPPNPPPPDTLPPHLVGEFYASLVGPLYREPLCPEDAACLFGGGGGVGASLEWRWPRGLGAGLGYEVWFIDGNGVYELTTTQFLFGQVRYYGMRERMVHPYVGVNLGLLLLGNAFEHSTVGAGASFQAGFELEITSTLAFTSHLSVRAFATGPFRSSGDGVARAQSFGVDLAGMLTVGLVLLQGP